MTDILHTIKCELLHVLPPIPFLFFTFNLLLVTTAPVLLGHDLRVRSMLIATVLAVIGGKTVPLADHLPFINEFPGRPLIDNIVRTTSIYTLAVLLARYLEHLIPFLFGGG